MSTYENILPALPKKRPVAVLIAYSAFIVWASLKKTGNGASIPHLDKVLHFVIYAILAALACWVLSKMDRWKIWLGASLYGGLMELCQGYFTQGRMASLADALANAIGAAIAVLLYGYWAQYRRSKT